MTNDLRKLIEAVETSRATMHDFASVFPSESAYGKTTWGTAHNAFSGSVDAAIALCEALLPGWKVAGLHQEDRGLWWAELRQGHITSYSRVIVAPHSFDAPNPARALLLAVLRAKLMEMENE